jgi:tetratricopeptide (TPR) repeat protein
VALRRRLEDYYRDNPNARVRIAVVKGSYNPTFTWVYQELGAGQSAQPITLPDVPDVLENGQVWESAPEIADQPPNAPIESTAVPPRHRSTRIWKRVVPVVLAAAALIAGLLLWRSRQTTHLTGNHTIVISEFADMTGDPIFNGTLKQGLTIQLEQSPFVNIVSDAKMAATLKLMNRPANELVTQQIALEICERTNTQAVIEPSIASVGTPYLIVLRAVNCQTGETLASSEAKANNRDSVLGALETAAIQLRQKLGESLDSVQRFNTPLEQATTSSLDALKAYSDGNRLVKEKGESDAIPYFQRAIELDGNFASAYLALGTIYANSLEVALGQMNLRKAFELRDRVAEQERFQIMATYYLVVTGELEKSLAICRQWARTYPQDVIAHVDLSAEYDFMGESEKAAAEGEEAVRLDPVNYKDYGNPFAAYCALNRLHKAEAMVEQARERGLDCAVNLAYTLAFLEGDEAEMKRQLSLVRGKRWMEDSVVSEASDVEAYQGHLRKARELSAEAIDTAERNGAHDTAALWKVNEALREAEFGNARRAREDAKAAVGVGGDRDVDVLAAVALARAGDSRQAQQMMAGLDARFPLDSFLQHYWFPTIRATVALNEGNADAAIEALQGKTAYELGAPPQLNVGPMYPVYVRGQAFLKAKRPQDAAAQFRKIIEHPGVTMTFPSRSLAHLQLGRALAMSGDTAGARREYQDFFSLWKDADADIPILKTAKAEYARLR